MSHRATAPGLGLLYILANSGTCADSDYPLLSNADLMLLMYVQIEPDTRTWQHRRAVPVQIHRNGPWRQNVGHYNAPCPTHGK